MLVHWLVPRLCIVWFHACALYGSTLVHCLVPRLCIVWFHACALAGSTLVHWPTTSDFFTLLCIVSLTDQMPFTVIRLTHRVPLCRYLREVLYKYSTTLHCLVSKESSDVFFAYLPESEISATDSSSDDQVGGGGGGGGRRGSGRKRREPTRRRPLDSGPSLTQPNRPPAKRRTTSELGDDKPNGRKNRQLTNIKVS